MKEIIPALQKLQDQAAKNWAERKELFAEMHRIIESTPVTGKTHGGNDFYELENLIVDVDDNFRRKFYYYPGDITTSRIAKLCEKLLARIST